MFKPKLVSCNNNRWDEHQNSGKSITDTLLELVRENKVNVNSRTFEFDEDLEAKQKEFSLYEQAKDKGSARLYISLSNLFSISAYVALTFVVYLVYLWLKINHDLAYVQDVDVIRLNGFLNRIEGVFKYLASIGLGFVAGVCKIFLKEKIGR